MSKNKKSAVSSKSKSAKSVSKSPATKTTKTAPKAKSITEQVSAYLTSGKGLTTSQAYDKFGTNRLSAVIYNLRERGLNIVTNDINETRSNGTKVKVSRYSLKK